MPGSFVRAARLQDLPRKNLPHVPAWVCALCVNWNQEAIETYAELITRKKIDCAFIRTQSYVYSTRASQPLELEAAAGSAHRTGENSEGDRYVLLRERAKAPFPRSREVAYWSAQDCITLDGIPYIGPFSAVQNTEKTPVHIVVYTPSFPARQSCPVWINYLNIKIFTFPFLPCYNYHNK